jgi:L-aspartate oxidase
VVAADVDRTDSGRVAELHVPSGALRARPTTLAAETETLRNAMWRDVGVVRDAEGLHRFVSLHRDLFPRLSTSVEGRNLAEVAGLIARAATNRPESRGGHYRSDYPDPDPALQRRSVLRNENPVLERLAGNVVAA